MLKSKIFYVLLLLTSIYATYQLVTTKPIKIDKIYVINLDRSKDRYASMQAKLDKMDLPVKYTRFSAFDGNNIELVNKETGDRIKGSEFAHNKKLLKGEFDIICSHEWAGGFEPLKLNLIDFHPRVKGELGIACSHRKIWQEIIENNYQNVLILEDDLNFAPKFDKYLDRALNNVPKNFDLIYLGIMDSIDSYKDYLKNKWLRKVKRIFDRNFSSYFFKQIRRSVASAEAYIVNQSGAQKLLQNTKKHKHIDIIMSKLIEEKKIIAYVIKPVQTHQTGITSTIGVFSDTTFETLKQEE